MFFHSSGVHKSEHKMLAGHAPSKDSRGGPHFWWPQKFLGLWQHNPNLYLSAHCRLHFVSVLHVAFSALCMSVLRFPCFYKDNSQSGLGPILTVLSSLDHLQRPSHQIRSHLHVLGGLGLQYTTLGNTIPPLTPPILFQTSFYFPG